MKSSTDQTGAPAPAPALAQQPAGIGAGAGPAAPRVAIVGGGPAGLMAAEALLCAPLPAGRAHPPVRPQVHLYDAMPSLGRKFLLAGKGGLNLTHSEPLADFIARYAEAAPQVAAWLQQLGPQALRDWAADLGIDTFVGSSGRVFPQEMKAAPLLRAWLHRLRAAGLQVHVRHRWLGWQGAGGAGTAAGEGGPPGGGAAAAAAPADAAAPWPAGPPGAWPPRRALFHTPAGQQPVQADAWVLALGGGSWPQLGSDGAWQALLARDGVAVAPLQPANCGFEVGWSPFFAERFAGAPLKTVRLRFDDGLAAPFDRPGECVVTAHGIEGSLVYAAAARIRQALARQGPATVRLDLLPARSLAQLTAALARGRGSRSVANHLKEQAGLEGVKAALLRERWPGDALREQLDRDPAGLAALIKDWPLVLRAPRPLAEAISSAGGLVLDGLDAGLMLRRLPGVFACGEMLDWEAPTGGYLLTASMASGRVAGQGVARWLAARAAGGHPPG